MSSKKNYNKISTDAAKANVETKNVVETAEEPETKVEVKEEAPAIKVTYGVVSGCDRLNVRSKPNIKSDVICTILKGTEVVVAESGSTKDFYEVHSKDQANSTEGFHGFCMKQYVTIKK